MPRPSVERLPQSQLTSELKRWIDTARFALDDGRTYGRAFGEIMALLRDHPVSAVKPHVLHNLGIVRRRWLGQLAAKLPDMPSRELVEEMGRWRVI